ncbi:MAG: hypothetical protein ACRBI6_08530 [Acidimicrobiales bacterium]
MLLWFVILAPVLVAEIFRSPMIDYRLVALGAALPLAEAALGGPNVLHTLLGAVGLLTIVMLATPNRRLVRRRLLGIPIGLFFHLALDASWARTELFWWPFVGLARGDGWSFGTGQIPELERPVGVIVALEVVAVAVGWWAWKRYELGDDDNRSFFVRTGQLTRAALP